MDPFLKKFFPVVYRRAKVATDTNNYCKYDNQGLQLFTSSLYLAGLTSTFFASYTTRKLGRKITMLIAGIFFIVGVIFNAGAVNLAMLIIGRILLGCGVGFANQVFSYIYAPMLLYFFFFNPSKLMSHITFFLKIHFSAFWFFFFPSMHFSTHCLHVLSI